MDDAPTPAVGINNNVAGSATRKYDRTQFGTVIQVVRKTNIHTLIHATPRIIASFSGGANHIVNG